ncbi:MAG: YncE family protein [Meiothermus sp.]|uniref:YncE family protein n=1 Tax=Meiothermus sp. TaxID=1955249 RepID=UPI00262CF974|nr:YncE family protein [Meiothermus sp.]MCS7058613.1 YncE family protein [Meiothermus sp.]
MSGIHPGWRAVLLLFSLMVYRSQAEALGPAGQGASSPPPIAASPGLKAGLPGMPPYDPKNVYAFTAAGMLSPVVRDFPERVYVPDGKTNRLYVIDPKTYRVMASYMVDAEPQHVVPAYDLRTLYVANDVGNTLIPIDPKTGTLGKRIPVKDPYNLYFTPDGKSAIVVAEYQRRLDFFDPKTWKPQGSLSVPCKGINHMDYSADGRTLVAACEFSGDLLRIDVAARKVRDKLHLGGMPQDVKLSPDGQVFYVADMMADGVHLIDALGFRKVGFIPTGKGAHGLYPSRDAKYLYISNRGEGSVSVLEFATRKLVAKWRIPGGGSPDMGGVSADGKRLWLSGRYHGEVYVFDTDLQKGGLIRRIKVGKSPHGLAVYPQPGRYSLGHTGVMR